MKFKLKKVTIDIESFAIELMIIVTLAFHNYMKLLMFTQIICCAIILLSAIKSHRIKLDKIGYLIWFGLFTTIGGASLLWATKSTTNVVTTTISLIQELVVGFSIVLYMSDADKQNKVFKYISYSSIILLLRMIIQVPMSAWGTERVGVYIGYGNNGAPMVLSFAALISFHLFQETKSKKDLFLALLFLAFSFLCGSKKALLIALVGITLLIILKSKNPVQIVKRLVLSIIVIGIMIYIIMNIEPLYNVLGMRIEKMIFALNNKEGADMSTIDRMNFAKIAYNVFLNHPFIGVGLDNYRYYNNMQYYAHNNYLEIAADLGIVGLISYYIMPMILLFKSFCSRKKNDYILLITMLITIFISDVAVVSFELDSTQLYIAVLYGIFIINKSENFKFNKIKNRRCYK